MTRKEEMLKLRLEGKSYTEIGEFFGISKQRVHQVLKSIPLKKRYTVVEGK